MAEQQFDLVVIGSGPGGYVAAIRATQLGMKVAVVEQADVGGICLNWGCIPTKALLRSAEVYHLMQRGKDFGLVTENISVDFPVVIQRSRRVATRLSKGVEFLFRKNKITLLKGCGVLSRSHEVMILDDTGTDTGSVHATNILLATGARARELPGVPFDGDIVISSREALNLSSLPKSMVIIGAGAIGVEFAYFYHTMGCQVHLVEMMPTILPIEDPELTKLLVNQFKKSKMQVYTDSIVKTVTKEAQEAVVTIAQGEKEWQVQAEKVLVAIGVQGNIEQLGLEKVGVEVERGWIRVDENYRTTMESVYAIGDIIGPPWLAHVASAEGIIAVEKIAGLSPRPLDYRSIPGCTYCKPQLASIGLTEQAALEQGYNITVGRFPFQANGKSIALGENIGLVKLIYDKKTDQLLGAHILHAEATEMINELSVVMNNNVEGHDLIKSIHAHPTLSESIMEAAAAAYGEAIHV